MRPRSLSPNLSNFFTTDMNRSQQPENTGQPSGAKHLFGIGLDGKDGHKRLTKAERFAIVGGSEETHERMTETLMKTFETLERKGKDIDQVSGKELGDIIQDSTPS